MISKSSWAGWTQWTLADCEWRAAAPGPPRAIRNQQESIRQVDLAKNYLFPPIFPGWACLALEEETISGCFGAQQANQPEPTLLVGVSGGVRFG